MFERLGVIMFELVFEFISLGLCDSSLIKLYYHPPSILTSRSPTHRFARYAAPRFTPPLLRRFILTAPFLFLWFLMFERFGFLMFERIWVIDVWEIGVCYVSDIWIIDVLEIWVIDVWEIWVIDGWEIWVIDVWEIWVIDVWVIWISIWIYISRIVCFIPE